MPKIYKMRLIITAFFTACLFVMACKNNADKASAKSTPMETLPSTTPAPVTDQSLPTANTQEVVTPPPTKSEPAQNAQGVWHFTCPKGCKGGGGAVGPCAKCGATLVHNAAYHAGATPAPTTASATPATKTEPPQNAKGVWHFTCPKGCAGGGGSPTPCAKCGTTLAHNAAYH